MRTLKHFSIALAAVALLAACSKQETKIASAAAEAPPAAQASTAAIESQDPAADIAAPEAPVTPETSTTPAAQPAAQTSSGNLPAPMLPRRGEAAASGAEKADPAVTQRIGIADAWEILRAGDGVLVDVRNADAYQYQRIPGALSVPFDQVAGRAGDLPQDKWIITYCTCPAEESSGAAAMTLSNMGFPRVAALLGGMQAWRAANLPVEFGQ